MTNVLSRQALPEDSADYDPLVAAYQTETQDISLVTIVNVLLRHRWLLIFSMIFGYVIFAFGNYTPYKTYTATTTFAPRSRAEQSIQSSVLSQLGIGGGGGGGGGGGAYYMEVMRSPRILSPVVHQKYSFQTETGNVTKSLIEVWGLQGAPPAYARAQAVGSLAGKIKTVSPAAGGIMKLSVTTEYAALSALVAQRILEEINRFNLETRQAHASAERQFIEARVAEARIALSDTENAMQIFNSENQNFQPISRVSLEWERMVRDVKIRQELYTSLAKALDQAKIDEVRDSPVITLIEKAEIPLGPDPTVWPRKAILGALIGLFFGILIAFLHSYVVRTRDTYTDDYGELERLKRETGKDMRNPFRPIARILATGRP